MSARSISRLATTGLVAGALTVALAVPALAMPATDGSPAERCDCGGARTTSHAGTLSGNVTTGTDVAAHDQQNPIPAPEKRIVPSAPTFAENTQSLPRIQPVAASTGGDFEWGDAGIGAGGALVIALTALGGVAIVRRRGTPDGPVAA